MVDSIAVSVFAVILVEFDKYRIQLEVGAWRAPTLLVFNILFQKI